MLGTGYFLKIAKINYQQEKPICPNCKTSSGLPRKCSAIFRHLQKFSEILEKCSGTFVWSSGQFEKSLEIFGRWSEIFGKSSKTPSSVCLYNKKNITRQLEDMNFMFLWQEQYLTHSLRPLEHKIHIFLPPCNILYIYVYVYLYL